MCVFSAIFQVLPGCPLFVLSNRDESRNRPTTALQRHTASNGVVWLGGTDQSAGGTWLGLNQHGLVVAVTNRPKSGLSPQLRSRGLLCRDLLAINSVEAAVAEAQRQLAEYSFAGFNLLVLSATKSAVIEAGDRTEAHWLKPGVHTVTNRSLNDADDPRTHRAAVEVARRLEISHDWQKWLELGKEVCGLPAEGDVPGLCLMGPEWGTVSSTIIALPQDTCDVRYRYATGPPATTAYDDYSNDARSILGASSRSDIRSDLPPPHRMHLHGPWQYEFGEETGKVKMPGDWQTLFGDRTGTVHFRRRFGRPTNLDSDERVDLAFEGVQGRARITVNGTLLGEVTNSGPMQFPVTDLLQPSNWLEIEFTPDATNTTQNLKSIWSSVAIEISKASGGHEPPGNVTQL